MGELRGALVVSIATGPARVRMSQREPASLAVLTGAAKALAEARTLDDVGQIHDIAAAAAAYARAHDLGLESENYAVEIRLRAARKGGELLAKMEKAKGHRFNGNAGGATFAPPALNSLGIDKHRAKEFRLAAKPTERAFDGYIEAARENTGRLTVSGLDRVARGLSVHFASDTPEWNTPPEVIVAVRAALGGIDLDPCSNAGKPNVPARRHFTEKDDGLTREWSGRVYMNPPYGDVIKSWVEKFVEEYGSGRVSAAIALVPARTDTVWFGLLRDAAMCFVRGRLRFSESETSAPFPSVVAYFGPNRARFAQAFSDMGDIWRRVST